MERKTTGSKQARGKPENLEAPTHKRHQLQNYSFQNAFGSKNRRNQKQKQLGGP